MVLADRWPDGSQSSPIVEVVSVDELARAAGVDRREVDQLIGQGALPVRGQGYIAWPDAVAAGRTLRARRLARPEPSLESLGLAALMERGLFSSENATTRQAALPAAASAALHGLGALAVVMFTAAGLGGQAISHEVVAPEPLRLVFLALPGPGGGGGGGGARQQAPPPRAERQGDRTLSSPIPVREPPPPAEPPPQLEEPPPAPQPEELPPVVAPVATSASDERDRPGALEDRPAEMADSRGPGHGGGVGSGEGIGIGEGSGSGIGPGEGGGTGGGVYRPGSGIDPPRLLREVKPDYTDEARRQGINGEVLLEIVVRRDGTVGDIRLLSGLGFGLDRRAVDAVRQWRFAPARRLGTPVDVIVEVAVEFRQR
ncbi:MAG: TonB family protein [Acidobacteria bacterium]|nr:TonB family protein [Acidobacteriota bacterium]